MAFTGREVIDSRSYSTDANGITTGTRLWITETTSQAEATSWLIAQGVNIGSAHPEKAGIFLDKVGFSPKPDGTYDISGNYSPSGMFVIERVNKQNQAGAPYFRFYYGFVTKNIEVPYATKEDKAIPGTTPVVNVSAWMPKTKRSFLTNATIMLEVRVNKINFPQAHTIASQYNKLHGLQGNAVPYLFKSCDIRDASEGQQFLTYTWEDEYDQKAFGSGAGQIPYDNQGNTLILPNVTRSAYQEWLLKPSAAGPTSPPTFVSVPKFDFVQNGHLSLPGVSAGMFS